MSRREVSMDRVTMQQAFAGLKASYAIGEDSRYLPRLRGVNVRGTGADYHYATETLYFKGLERAREMDRSNMVIGQAVNRLCNNVLQQGLTLDPDTGDNALDETLTERWADFKNDPKQCDARAMMKFDRAAKLALRHAVVDGDIFALLRDDGHIQWVEGHRCRTPGNTKKSVVHGVLIDEADNRPLEYWFTKKEIGVNRRVRLVGDMEQVARRNPHTGELQVLHPHLPRRLSQTRGITAFLPMVFPASLHDDVQFANLVLAQTAACFTLIRTFPDIEAKFGAGTGQRGEQTTETLSDGSTRTMEGIAPGLEITGRPGEMINGFSPDVPSPQFKEHVMMILSIIAVNLDLPVAVLLLDPSNTNFSGWRGAMDQARVAFRDMQEIVADSIYTPAYRWQIRRWAMHDKSIARRLEEPALFRHKFNGPRWAYIEPFKDAQADVLRLAKGLTSIRAWCAERHGMDHKAYLAQVMEDRALYVRHAHEAADKLQTEGIDVTWREIAAFDFKVSPQAITKGKDDDDGDDDDRDTDDNPEPSRNGRITALCG
jgi:capsid protein